MLFRILRFGSVLGVPQFLAREPKLGAPYANRGIRVGAAARRSCEGHHDDRDSRRVGLDAKGFVTVRDLHGPYSRTLHLNPTCGRFLASDATVPFLLSCTQRSLLDTIGA